MKVSLDHAQLFLKTLCLPSYFAESPSPIVAFLSAVLGDVSTLPMQMGLCNIGWKRDRTVMTNFIAYLRAMADVLESHMEKDNE